MKLIPLTDKEKLKEICPFSIKTLYKWRSLGLYPDLTVKIAGKVCLSVDALEKMIKEGFNKQREKAERMGAIREEKNNNRGM